jgi:acyl-CoA synthetase (AMP-forming)/AMP-acid ligase II
MLFGNIMNYPLTVTRLLERARTHFSAVELVTKRPDGTMHRYAYRAAYQRICRLANALKRLGVAPGNRVGTLAWNHFQHVELYFAVPCSGAVIHTLNLRLSPQQLAYTINHAEDMVIFADASLLPMLEAIAPHIAGVKRFVILNATPELQTALPNVLHYEDLIANESDSFDWPELDERMAAGLCYTSGTTGNPKGALYSHRSQYLHTVVAGSGDALSLASTDTVLGVVPMFHANAWGLPYLSAALGFRFILPGPHLKPNDLAKLIQDEKVTVAAGVPTLWIGMYHEIKTHGYDISSLRALIVGGSAFPKAMIEAYEKELGVPVVHAWGMTEMSPMGTSTGTLVARDDLTIDERIEIKTHQGYAPLGVEMRIVDDAGRVLPWDGKSVGEIQVRGPWIISSYYNDPSGETQFTSDGWFRTGDVASLDPDGLMTIADRTKDLIKSGGEWISSVALENALMAHPHVLEAAVIAVPHEKWSERPLALVVPKTGVQPNVQDLLDLIESQFAKFWIPDEIRFVAEIPKTSVGKFDKKVLRQRYADGAL